MIFWTVFTFFALLVSTLTVPHKYLQVYGIKCLEEKKTQIKMHERGNLL